MKRKGVLFVSSSAEDAERLSGMLQPLSVTLVHVRTLEHARTKLNHETFGVVLTETDLADGDWKDVVTLACAEKRGVEVVVTDARADTRLWLDALERGAYDVVCQPFCSSEVQRILSNALSARPEARSAVPASQ